MNLEETFEEKAKNQIRFIELLRKFTDANRAEWFQSQHEPGFVYCLLDKEELVVFECRGGQKGDEFVPPSEKLAGVASRFCNTTYIWLSGLANWELLLQLLRLARVDEKCFIECRRIAHSAPPKVLEKRLSKLS